MPARTTKSSKQKVGAAAKATAPLPKRLWRVGDKPRSAPKAVLEDRRDETLARMRALIMEAAPGMVEERKWKKPSNGMVGIPVWSHDGIICTGETYKDKVKLTFAKGAALADPAGIFNSSLDGGTRRAIDIHEGEVVDARAFKALIKAAVVLNGGAKKK